MKNPAMAMAVLAVMVSGLGSGCGGGNSSRTVTGVPAITFTPDSGASSTVRAPAPDGSKATGIWVPTSDATGYKLLPVTAAQDGSFAVRDVPRGTYFLELDRPVDSLYFDPADPLASSVAVRTREVALAQLTTSDPDLTVHSASRPDLVTTTDPTPVVLDLSGATPFGQVDDVLVVSAQAGVTTRPITFGVARPPVGSTSVTRTFDWVAGADQPSPGLPDAGKGDVTYVTHRLDSTVGTGATAGEFRRTVDAGRLTDFTLAGAVSPTLTVTFPQPAPAPTGQLSHDLRNAQFAALAPGVFPTGVPGVDGLIDPPPGVFVAEFASPHSLSYPDWPQGGALAHLAFIGASDATTDVDYGALPYLQFLDPLWKPWRQITYGYRAPGSVPATAWAGGFGSYLGSEAVGAGAPGPVVPVVGPVLSPRLNGQDAFVSRAASEPVTFSWSPPSLGTPTSYVVRVSLIPLSAAQVPAAGDVASLVATLHAGTSFRVPPGFLKAGRTYQATITAVQGPPWDVLDRAVLAQGTPLYMMDCVTASFSL